MMNESTEARIARMRAVADLVFQQGKQAEGIQFALEVCHYAKEWLGADHPEYATSLNQLAFKQMTVQHYGEAEASMLEALKVYERALGVNHANYATALFNLAVLYHNMENVPAAGSYDRQALDAQRRILGPHHAALITTLTNFIVLLDSKGDMAGLEAADLQLLDVQRAVHGNRSREVANSLGALVQRFPRTGQDVKAIPLQKEAVTITRELAGEDSAEYATNLNNLAEFYRVNGQYADAEPLYHEALAVDHVRDADQRALYSALIRNLALLYHEKGDNAAAEPLQQEGLNIVQELYGRRHPEVARSLNMLGALYSDQAKYAEAEKLLGEGLDIRRSTLGAQHPDVATSLNNVALLFERSGRYAAAEKAYREASDVWRRAFGARSSAYATSLSNLGNLCHATGRYEEGVTYHTEALEIRRSVFGDNHLLVANSLDNLGTLCSAMGDYAKAERLLLTAVATFKSSVGDRNQDYAICLGNLASMYRESGNYAAAQSKYEEALDILRTSVGERHPAYATTLNNLALLYQQMHNDVAAEAYHRQTLAIRQATLREQHPDVGQSFNNLGTMLWEVGRLDEALECYLRALPIRQVALGRRHPDVAQTLNNLATLSLSLKRFDKAVSYLEEAIDIYQSVLGSAHPTVLQSLNNLAVARSEQGDFAEAESLHRRVLEMRRNALGNVHPDVAQSLFNLAWLHARTKRDSEAFTLVCQASLIDDHMLAQVCSVGDERQRMAYLDNLRKNLYFLVALAVRIGATVPGAVRSAFDIVLRRKAVSVEVLALERNAILAGRYSNAEKSLRELSALRTRIARALLSGSGTSEPEAWRQHLAEWEAERDRLERDVVRQIPDFHLDQQLTSADCAAVAKALPSDTCLVEFVHFYDFDFDGGTVTGPRYAAFVLKSNAADDVRLVDLGESPSIERLIARWRAAIAGRPEPRDADGAPTARDADGIRGLIREAARNLAPTPPGAPGQARAEGDRLRALLLDPLRGALGGCRRLLIAPDAELALLPFEALSLDKDRYLVDEYTISYVGVGRDVLRFGSTPATAPGTAVVMFDPNYDLGGEAVPAFARNTPFPRLEGGLQEGRAVAALLGIAPTTGAEAVESRLRGLQSPRILHIATHGFFHFHDAEPLRGDIVDNVIAVPSQRRLQRIGLLSNPMLRAGLALAGANTWAQDGTPPAEAEDGILTAEDVTGLDLLNTELVVLSACETGMGDVHKGEGLFGLRRAFTIAGAMTLVMSLWKVPDLQTRDLMAVFYEDLVQGKSRVDALRNAQLRIRSAYPQPFYWAAFICQGEIGPLRSRAN